MVSKEYVEDQEQQGEKEADDEAVPFRFKFTCGRHLCDVCGEWGKAMCVLCVRREDGWASGLDAGLLAAEG